jgi:hypothetical protein
MAEHGYASGKEERRKQVARDLEFIRGHLSNLQAVIPQMIGRLEALEALVGGKEPAEGEGVKEEAEGVTD